MDTFHDQLFSVAGKCAVVTGGTRGVGFMIARGLVEAGARVYIASRDARACTQIAAELSVWGECVALPADVSTVDGCRQMADKLAAAASKLHLLVNNAGVTLGAPLDSFGDPEWDRVLAVNLKGVFNATRFLRPLLEAAASDGDPARVINIGSVDGLHIPPMENYSYSSSKAAVHHLTRHLAKRLGPKVTVNALALGPFLSDMTDASLAKEMGLRAPLGRIGTPEDAAGAVIFLASRAGSFLTGAVIPVDGGLFTTA
jgi:NAD(P)-dependent dehydrogenase (short-subunit alcohol dehydrogenase family)